MSRPSTPPPNTTNTNTDTNVTVNVNTPANPTVLVNETIAEPGLEIHNQQQLDASSNYTATTTFTSTQPEVYDPNINQHLNELVSVYDDTQNTVILNQIKAYAAEIQCSDFHGKGSIDDYQELFKAASKIANESKQIELDVDIEGFNEFSQAADDLSQLFESFTLRLQNINIINDLTFLTAIANALQKIVKLSNVFGRFKKTILSTTTIQIPKSAHETKVALESVIGNINCAMNYIGHFVDASNNPNLPNANLSAEEQNIIQKAVDTIDNWNLICEQGVSIAMNNNEDIKYITQASNQLKQTTNQLKQLTSTLQNKLYINLNRQ